MLILDTDHLSEFDKGSRAGERLYARLDEANAEVATTIVTVEEQLRGWLAQIHRESDPHRQIPVYDRLRRRIEFFARWNVLSWDLSAADQLLDLKSRSIRLGTMDLKIASITLAVGATLLSRNLKNFYRVPGLHVEDWLS